MPFSGTKSCTEQEWAHIFEQLFKPAVEGAGLDYECRRAVATRGNIVAGIVRDLDSAYVVLAELTDRNANVFYELGVREALRNRTILVAQRREDIPFDLQGYASHVYDWKSEEGQRQFASKIRELLVEIDAKPDRADNPVSDFLDRRPPPQASGLSSSTAPRVEAYFARPLVGPEAEGVDAITMARNFARRGPPTGAREVYRLTRPELVKALTSTVQKLNRGEGGPIQPNDIPSMALRFVTEGEPLVTGIERFALTSVQDDWKPGVTDACMRFAGDMVTVSELPYGGWKLRFATGLPALLAWRLLILMGSKALAEGAFDLAFLILRYPIEVEKQENFSHRPLLDRRDLFYSEAFLGYADHTILYLVNAWDRQPHLQELFESRDAYHFQLAQFLAVVCLAYAAKGGELTPLYPGYKLIPQVERALSALTSRLEADPPYRESIAAIVLDDDGRSLQKRWPSLASQLNSTPTGDRHWLSSPALKLTIGEPS